MILHHRLRRLLLIVATYLVASVVLNALRQHHVVSAETVVRLMGMVVGLAVLVCANAIPKQLVPLARLSCAPTREQTLRRVCGWAGVLGGLGYTLAYALAPFASAGKLANSLLAPAVAVVAVIAVRCAWVRISRRRRMT
jgi:hypothetical protein